jgi:hypothetical protein
MRKTYPPEAIQFVKGIIKAIRQFKNGQGKTYYSKDEFLESFKNL